MTLSEFDYIYRDSVSKSHAQVLALSTWMYFLGEGGEMGWDTTQPIVVGVREC